MAEQEMEKKNYSVEHGGVEDYAGERKGSIAMGEAEALYGNIADAEQYGYV